MTAPLLTTKLTIPPVRPGLVPRPRLIARLNAVLPREGRGFARALTLVSAPAGFGKTTLLSSWLHQLADQESRPSAQSAWLSLDDGDNDPARFLPYLVAALQTPALSRVAGGIDGDVAGMLQSPQRPPIEALLTALINEIASVSSSFILVLDDYHVITAQPIHDALAFLLDHRPPTLHVVLATRADPPLPLARLRGRGQLTELRQADLRFTRDEMSTFFKQALGLDLTPRDAAALDRRTEGWIAGLQLAAISMQGLDDVAGFIAAFSGSHRYVIDYLAEEVLQRQSEETRRFLCQTGILDRLTGPLCDALTGREDSRSVLARLEQANLFLIPLDDHRDWYRYHPLFADFLRTQVEPRRRASLHRRAAQWYEANGFLPQAVKHALAVGDVEEAGRVIGLAAEGARRKGQVNTLLRWLDALPDEFVRARGQLARHKALALSLAGHVEAAESYLEAAENSLPADAAPTSRSGLVHLHASLALSRGDFATAIRRAQEALDLVGDADPAHRSAILNILGRAQWQVGDIAAATQTYREALRLSHPGRVLSAVSALGDLALLLHLQGQRREATALCEGALSRCTDGRGRPLPIGGIPHIILGMMDYETNQLTRAREHLLTGIELCQQFPVTILAIVGTIALARLRQTLGEEETAWETMQEAHQMASQMPPVGLIDALLEAAEAELRLRGGDVAAAARWADARSLSPADLPHAGEEPSYLTYAHLLLAQNRPRDARTLVARLARSAQEQSRFRDLITIHILQALTQEALDHQEEALAHMEQALVLAAPEGYSRAFLDEGPAVARLLPQVRHVAPDFVGQLLAGFGAEARRKAGPRPTQPLVEPLTPRELEVLRLIASGRSNRDIADELVVAQSTVKKHINHIYGKLGVKSRTQAILLAQDLGLLQTSK